MSFRVTSAIDERHNGFHVLTPDQRTLYQILPVGDPRTIKVAAGRAPCEFWSFSAAPVTIHTDAKKGRFAAAFGQEHTIPANTTSYFELSAQSAPDCTHFLIRDGLEHATLTVGCVPKRDIQCDVFVVVPAAAAKAAKWLSHQSDIIRHHTMTKHVYRYSAGIQVTFNPTKELYAFQADGASGFDVPPLADTLVFFGDPHWTKFHTQLLARARPNIPTLVYLDGSIQGDSRQGVVHYGGATYFDRADKPIAYIQSTQPWAVTAHEIGHMLMLGDENDIEGIMNPPTVFFRSNPDFTLLNVFAMQFYLGAQKVLPPGAPSSWPAGWLSNLLTAI